MRAEEGMDGGKGRREAEGDGGGDMAVVLA